MKERKTCKLLEEKKTKVTKIKKIINKNINFIDLDVKVQ